MDFMNRNTRNVPTGRGDDEPTQRSALSVAGMVGKAKKNDPSGKFGGFFTVGTIALLISIAILIGALASYFAFGNNGTSEAEFVDKSAYQAVFVNVNGTNGGQVYFGHVQTVTDNYIDLTNVFYIQNSNSSSSSTNSSYTLVKLGCELHAPQDEMVINRGQVYFWENLKSNGQVAQKISEYYKNNPNGQNCSQSSASNSTSQASTSTQPSTSSSTKTTH
jgi:hypothetical protein